ncbi:hypothetical protein BH23DEI1_BH23DEI1_18980 [soil metagenome]
MDDHTVSDAPAGPSEVEYAGEVEHAHDHSGDSEHDADETWGASDADAEHPEDEQADIDLPDDGGTVDAQVPGGRSVPMAWRGLGSEVAGPARPLDAQVPQRLDPAEQRAFDEARRVTMRRTLLLWALVLAVALFAWTQFWANGRASAAYDEGLRSFREAEFSAAEQVWSRLAAAGDPDAQFMLGYMRETGLGRPWSARAAAQWYLNAAEAGHQEAQWRLGTLYDRGLGVAWSPAEAHRWWAVAAQGGHAEAAFTLGRSLFTSARSASELEAAAAAFDRAAALGWPDAATYHALLSVVSAEPNANAIP